MSSTGFTEVTAQLIEQAAESYQVWRGTRPDTACVYEELRRLIAAEALAAAR